MQYTYPLAGELERIDKTFIVPEIEAIEKEEFPLSSIMWGLGILMLVSVMAAGLRKR